MLERHRRNEALASRILHIPIIIVEHVAADAAQYRQAGGKRPDAGADHDGLLIVRLRPVVTLAIEDAGVHVAVIRGQLEVERSAAVGGVEESFTLDEHRALK